jgi:hypothetical protein
MPYRRGVGGAETEPEERALMNKQPGKRALKSLGEVPKRLFKELEEMRCNPQGDWQISDLQRICKKFGLSCTKPRGGGSHYKISSPRLQGILTVPAHRPIKVPYIKVFVSMMDMHIKASVAGGDDA